MPAARHPAVAGAKATPGVQGGGQGLGGISTQKFARPCACRRPCFDEISPQNWRPLRGRSAREGPSRKWIVQSIFAPGGPPIAGWVYGVCGRERSAGESLNTECHAQLVLPI